MSIFSSIYSSYELSLFVFNKEFIFSNSITIILKVLYVASISITWGFELNLLFNNIIKNNSNKFTRTNNTSSSSNSLIIGADMQSGSIVSIPEKGLYQNMLITRHHWNW